MLLQLTKDGCEGIFLGIHIQPSLGALIIPPPRRWAWLAAPRWLLPAPPSQGQFLDGPSPHFDGHGPQNPQVFGPSSISWLRYALCFACLRILTYVSYLCPAKLIDTKTCLKCELKTLILSFGIHICLFCLNVGGKNYELSTTYKLPHTQFFAHP